jgi:hypothetical protein
VNPIGKNILAVVGGWVIGSVVNMGLIKVGHKMYLIEGIDPSDMVAFEIMPTLSNEHFIFPFLAHALGTLIGAVLAASIAATYKMRMALIVGAIFLLGGIMVNYMLHGPTWFAAVDVLIAYISMAWIGGKLVTRKG